MQNAKVLQLFITQNDTNKTKLSPSQVTLTPQGIIGDKFFDKDLQRAILITSIHSYEMAKDKGIMLEYGALGENILIDTNPYSLLEGDTIRIGDATLEITQNCTLCKGLSTLDPHLPKLLKNDRGIFAKLIQNDECIVQVGDSVYL